MEKKRKLSVVKAEDITRTIQTGSIEEFKNLVSREIDFNAILSTDLGSLPIHVAALSGRIDIIEFLLANGVNADSTDKCGWTPLHYAVMGAQLAVIKHLIVEMKSNFNVANEESNSLLHFACEGGNSEVVDLLLNGLEKYPEIKCNLNVVDEWGNTPLHAACKRGNEAVVGLLLNALEKLPMCERNLSLKNCRGFTPLHYACFNAVEEVFSLILNAFKRLTENERNMHLRSEVRITPHYNACYTGDEAIVSLMLNALEKLPVGKRNLNIANEEGDTPLHVACDSGNEEVVCRLLNSLKKLPVGERNYNMVNINGDTPLHIACNRGVKAVVCHVLNSLEEYPMDVLKFDIVNKKGYTPLHVACHKGNTAVVNHLLNVIVKFSKAERDLNAVNEEGNTPLHIACERSNEAVVDLLLNAGARSDIKNRCGVKALYLYLQVRSFKLEQLQFTTLEKLSPYTNLNNHNFSLAHLITRFGDLKGLKTMLRLQKNLNVLDMEGYTPLNYLTEELAEDLEDGCNKIKLLIKHGAHFNTKDCATIFNNHSARNVLLTDSKLCSQSCFNKLVNEAIPSLYDSPLSPYLPPREILMPGSDYLTKLKSCVNIEIRKRVYCDLEKPMFPLFYLSAVRLSNYCKGLNNIG